MCHKHINNSLSDSIFFSLYNKDDKKIKNSGILTTVIKFSL